MEQYALCDLCGLRGGKLLSEILEGCMGRRRVAVVGAGMTKFVRRALETGRELAFEAASKALESCELTLDQVEAVVMGTAPDAFDGVHMKAEWLSDGARAWGKRYMRGYVGGGTGVFGPAPVGH